MFPFSTPRALEAVGADGYQEFQAGAIPLKKLLTSLDPPPLVLLEHERGFQRQFDQHLDAVRKRAAPCEDLDYAATWAGITGGPAGAALIRLELQIDGLRARSRLLFRDGILPALWFLAEGADLGLLLGTTGDRTDVAVVATWVLGPTPLPRELRRILRDLEIPVPVPLLMAAFGRRKLGGRARPRWGRGA
jgi:hypothetical protein